MEMKTVEITVTSDMQPYVNSPDENTEFRQRALLLYPYVHDQIISHGRAAELLGISKWELITLYGDMGIPYIDMDADELAEDIANAAFVSDQIQAEKRYDSYI